MSAKTGQPARKNNKNTTETMKAGSIIEICNGRYLVPIDYIN